MYIKNILTIFVENLSIMANIPLTENERRAWDFSKEKHKLQIRKFLNIPYFDAHVQKVNGIVKMYTQNEIILIASILHDVLEDCFKNKWEGYSVIRDMFGETVTDLVMELTSDKDIIKYKYNGSKKDYLSNKMINMSDGALIIKLADRLQNISDVFTADESFRIKYVNETIYILDRIESARQLNKIQKVLFLDIKMKLENIKKIFGM